MRAPLLAIFATALAIVPAARAQDFDPALFQQSCDNVTNERIKEGQALTGNKDAIAVYNVLLKINTLYFARDAGGRRNPRADANAFRTAISNMTPEMLTAAVPLLAESNGVPASADDRRTLSEPTQEPTLRALFVLGAGARAFVQPSGAFNGPAYQAAIAALDKPAIAKANAVFGSEPPYSFFLLLHVAARTVDAKGQPAMALLKKTLEGIRPGEIAAEKDQELIDALVARLKAK